MARELMLWAQNGQYPARLDRAFLEAVTRRKNRVFRGLAVSQRGAGANFSIDVTAGEAMVLGTSQDWQGAYFARSTATENVPVPASPASGTRTDTVILQVRDPQAGGPDGNDWIFAVITGTTLPTDALAIATITRTAAEAAILNAAITDVRPLGEWSWTVGTAPPPARGVAGDLYVQVAP